MEASKRFILLCAFCLLPTISQAAPILAKDFPTKTTGGLTTDGSWNIWANGYIANTFTVVADGDYLLEIEAKGDLAGSDAPNMRIDIDGIKLIDIPVTNIYKIYSNKIKVIKGTHEIRIYFTNDYYIGLTDRNLIVKTVNISPVVVTPPVNPCGVEDIQFNGTTSFTGTLNVKTGKGSMEFN